MSFNLDNDALTADEATAQDVFDRTDRYVDARARILGLTADAGATGGRMIATGSVWFGRLSDCASADARVEGYFLRGSTGAADGQGDQSRAAAGQMNDMRRDARAEIDEILRAKLRGTGLTDGPAVIAAPRHPCVCDAIQVIC
jgi:hypothetical protein